MLQGCRVHKKELTSSMSHCYLTEDIGPPLYGAFTGTLQRFGRDLQMGLNPLLGRVSGCSSHDSYQYCPYNSEPLAWLYVHSMEKWEFSVFCRCQ